MVTQHVVRAFAFGVADDALNHVGLAIGSPRALLIRGEYCVLD